MSGNRGEYLDVITTRTSPPIILQKFASLGWTGVNKKKTLYAYYNNWYTGNAAFADKVTVFLKEFSRKKYYYTSPQSCENVRQPPPGIILSTLPTASHHKSIPSTRIISFIIWEYKSMKEQKFFSIVANAADRKCA